MYTEGRTEKGTDWIPSILDVRLRNHFSKIFSLTCKGHDTVVSLSAGNDTRPAEA